MALSDDELLEAYCSMYRQNYYFMRIYVCKYGKLDGQEGIVWENQLLFDKMEKLIPEDILEEIWS